MRRIALTTLLAVVVLLLGALPAAAASWQVTSPSDGTRIADTGTVDLRVSVSHDLNEDVSGVSMRIVAAGASSTYPGTQPAALSCVANCDQLSPTTETWAGTLEPAAPFGSGGQLPNGSYRLEAAVNGGAYGGGVGVSLELPPSPVSGLSASADGPDVTLTWTRAPEPDISAYRVQRRPDGGSWAVVGSTEGTASSYEDTDVPSTGIYEYRVVTARPDGHGGVLTATSSATSVTTTSTSDPTTSPSTTDGGGTSSDGSTGGSSDDGATSDGGTTDGGAQEPADGSGSDTDGSTTSDGSSSVDSAAATGEDGDGGSTSTRSPGGTRVAAPPGVRRGSSLDIDAQLPGPLVAPRAQQGDERFYGEGEGFSEELDYGAAEPISPEGSGSDTRTVLERIPGGVQEFIVSRFETRTLLSSIAAGLLFVALGLHAYRWMHATPSE